MTVLLTGVPLVLLGILTLESSQVVLQATSDRQGRAILEERRRFIQTLMEEVESLAANVAGQEAILSELQRPAHAMGDYDRLATQAKIGSVLSGYVNLKGLVSIDVFAPSGVVFHGGDTLDVGPVAVDEVDRLLKATSDSTTSVYWSGTEVNLNGNSSFHRVVTATKLLGIHSGRVSTPSLLVICYDPAIFSGVDDQKGDSFCLVLDAQNRVVSGPSPDQWGQPIPPGLETPIQGHQTRFPLTSDRRSYIVQTIALTKGGWQLAYFSSTRDLSLARVAILIATLLALGLAFVLVVFASNQVSRRVVEPILKITKGLQMLREPAAAHPQPFSFDSHDEIGALVLWYNTFLDHVEDRQRIATELHLRQEELKELNRTLEQRVVAEVTANREKDSLLIQQSRQASMGEMIGNIAHQWRQPLHVVALLVQDLQMRFADGHLDQKGIDAFADDVLAVVDSMSATIDDFRDFFKPNKVATAFSLDSAVMTSLSFLEPSFRNHSIETVVDRVSVGTLVGYPNEFSQVILNILNNAQDVLNATNPSRKLVRIRLWSAGGRPRVSVADTGGGVPQDIVDRIFDPYFTTKAPGKGTGIGLFMCKTIVERNMGGRITVGRAEILPGLPGAEFTLEF